MPEKIEVVQTFEYLKPSRREQYREAKLAYFKNRSRELDNFVNTVLLVLDADISDTRKVDDILDYVIAYYERESSPRF